MGETVGEGQLDSEVRGGKPVGGDSRLNLKRGLTETLLQIELGYVALTNTE